MLQSRLPTPYHNHVPPVLQPSSIPTALSHRAAPGTPLKCASASSSRSTSPSHSQIPQPRTTQRTSGSDKQINSQVTRVGVRTAPVPSPYSASSAPHNKNSMLDKFKLFNQKEKSKSGGSSNKRTSSSSGISSTKSERSDSSTSLHTDSRPKEKKESEAERAGLKKKNNKGESKIVKPGSRPLSGTGIKAVNGTASSLTSHRTIPQQSAQLLQGTLQSRGPKASSPPPTTSPPPSSAPPHSSTPHHTATPPHSSSPSHSVPANYSPSPHSLIPQHCSPQINQTYPPNVVSAPQTFNPLSAVPSPTPTNNITPRSSTPSDTSLPPNSSVAPSSSVPPTSSTPPQTSTPPVCYTPPNSNSPPVAFTSQSPTMKDPLPNMMDITVCDASRLAPGSGIPKPTAIVKSYTRPTHSVAPMPPRLSPPPSPDKNQIDNGHEISVDKQIIYAEEEEESGDIKPMQPLLREYDKRSSSRTIPQDRSRGGYRPLAAYPVRSNTETNFIEPDHTHSVSSGYLSDGDMRQHSKFSETYDGYLSETGSAAYYQKIQDQRGICPLTNNLVKADHPSYNQPKFKCDSSCLLKEGVKVTNEQIEVSSAESHHTKGVRVVNGGVGRGSEVPPASHHVVYRVVSSRHVPKSDSSQQTDNTAFRQVAQSQFKGSPAFKSVEQDPRSKDRRNSPVPNTNGVVRKSEKKKIPSSGSREELDADLCNGSKKTLSCNGGKGGSKVKVASGGAPPSYGYAKRPVSNGTCKEQKATPSRTKVKVSGGTQTEGYSRGPALGSVGKVGPAPSGGIGSNVTASGRMIADMPDYAELASPYSASWLRHAPYAAHSLPTRTSASGVMMEAESIESLPAQLQHRASLTHTRILGAASTAPRLCRSNSIRSTKSEKLYPSMLQRSDEAEPYYSIPYSLGHSQPTSPTPSQMSQATPTSRFNYPISPISGSPSSHTVNRNIPFNKTPSKDDEVHGSAVSLVSTTSSLYSTPEDKNAQEVRKLKKELGEAQEKVQTLTHQLSTNAHVVSAFEQSLSSMTQRLQQLTTTSEKKDCELADLRQTIELLRKQTLEAGLTSPTLARRHTINSSEPPISRQLSTDSVSSLNSLSSTCSLSAQTNDTCDKKKKRGWLRSSFNKAFSRNKKNKNSSSSGEGEEGKLVNTSDLSAPSSPLLGHHPCQVNGTLPSGASPTSSSPQLSERESCDTVDELRKQLREKDLVLTDIRLEALSSAHQLESLKDTVTKMQTEMFNLKQDNERLQRLVSSKSLTSSQNSVHNTDSLERRFSMNDATLTGEVKYDLFSEDPEGKKVTVSVVGHKSSKLDDSSSGTQVAIVSISGKTKWDMLDAIIRKVFKDYLERVDPNTSLGLNADSLVSYQIGEVTRHKDSKLPDLLPCGYLIGDTSSITVSLTAPHQTASIDALAFESLIPKSIVQRYVSLLTEYRRIILCGPSGTGKTYLANKLAEYLARKAGRHSMAEAVATFNVECKSSKELRQYLTNVAEQCETNASDLPTVIILDNLHQASSLQEVFSGFLSARVAKCPYIIGTMNQATFSTTNLQLHHNFRWILCANHMEPVKGFLGRYLRRRLIETEVSTGVRNLELIRVVDWLPRAWQHINNFLETHNSSDVTIGPGLVLGCPMEVSGSAVWFTDLWNYSLVPYILEAVREGMQLFGRKAAWTDPASYLLHTFPWHHHHSAHINSLIRLRPEDVRYDQQGVLPGKGKNSASSQQDGGDPLMNMLMRLQEAANYSTNQTSESNGNSDNMTCSNNQNNSL